MTNELSDQELDDLGEERAIALAALVSGWDDEDECSVSYDGKHVDPRLDPDWGEVICSACHEVVES